MKWAVVIIFSGLAVFGVVTKNNQENRVQVQPKKSYTSVVVLELFTSEGCSSCPPADRLLPQLADIDSNVIPLSFHVDYWNNLGWKDPFSSPTFSNRQQRYGQHFNLQSIYTPQMIINGEYELVGSNRATAESDIKKLLKESAPVKVTVEQVKKDKDSLSVTCYLQGEWQKSDLLAVIVQKHAAMNVKAGENRGAKLSHTNVVRTFFEQPAKDKMNFEISVPKDLTDADWSLIIYTQQQSDLKITGAAMYDYRQ